MGRGRGNLCCTHYTRLTTGPPAGWYDAGADGRHLGAPARKCRWLKVKGYHSRSFRILLGTFKLANPRLFHCRCKRRKATSFRPLSSLLTESVALELLFMDRQEYASFQ